MNYWMTLARKSIARQYVFDMMNSFVEDPDIATKKFIFDSDGRVEISFYSPDMERLFQFACHEDLY